MIASSPIMQNILGEVTHSRHTLGALVLFHTQTMSGTLYMPGIMISQGQMSSEQSNLIR
jgi:hypothetical protein